MTYIHEKKEELRERLLAYKYLVRMANDELSNIMPNHQRLLKYWNKNKSYKKIMNFKGRRLIAFSNEYHRFESAMPFRIPIFEDDDIKVVKSIYKSIKRKCDRIKSFNVGDRYILTSSLTLFESAISNYLTREIILDAGTRFAILLNQLPRIDDVGERRNAIKVQMPNTVFEENEDTIFLVETTDDDHVYWLLNGGSDVPDSLFRT